VTPRGVLTLLVDNPVVDALGDVAAVLLAVGAYGGLTVLYRAVPAAALGLMAMFALVVAFAVRSWTRGRAKELARNPLVRVARATTLLSGLWLITVIGVVGPVLLADALWRLF